MDFPEIKDKKDVWLVLTNTDLTEGRGREYVQYFTETEATAIRLAKGNYVQGGNSPIVKGLAFKVNNTWFTPSSYIVPPTPADLKSQERLDELAIKKVQKDQAIQRARELGLTEEEIEALK